MKSEIFSNPVFSNGPDPFMAVDYERQQYYFLWTTGKDLRLRKAKHFWQLQEAPEFTLWTPQPNTSNAADIWAPEMYRLDHTWFLYYSATTADQNDSNRRIFVLTNPNPDPTQGAWEEIGQLKMVEDRYAIDGTLFEVNGKYYFVWSSKLPLSGFSEPYQHICIAQMDSPTQLGPHSVLSAPLFPWEQFEMPVNEGPAVLKKNKRIFLFYSASAFWSDFYALGLLSTTVDKDLLCPQSWKKLEHPVFIGGDKVGVWGVGHNSFFTCWEKGQDWIIYHGRLKPNDPWGNRSTFIQRVQWDIEGKPILGKPQFLANQIE